jgi:hypothetical protein
VPGAGAGRISRAAVRRARVRHDRDAGVADCVASLTGVWLGRRVGQTVWKYPNISLGSRRASPSLTGSAVRLARHSPVRPHQPSRRRACTPPRATPSSGRGFGARSTGASPKHPFKYFLFRPGGGRPSALSPRPAGLPRAASRSGDVSGRDKPLCASAKTGTLSRPTLFRGFVPSAHPHGGRAKDRRTPSFARSSAPTTSLGGHMKPLRLSGGTIVAGNEPYYLHGTSDRSSLSLPAGASASSPPMCVSFSPARCGSARAGPAPR